MIKLKISESNKGWEKYQREKKGEGIWHPRFEKKYMNKTQGLKKYYGFFIKEEKINIFAVRMWAQEEEKIDL